MKKKFLTVTILSAVIAAAIISCTSSSGKDSQTNTTATSENTVDTTKRIERGEYLVNTIGCDDCHSPKRMGAHGPELIPELRFSGFQKDGKLPPADKKAVQNGWALFAPDLTAAVGPWGISYASNISSDSTGIGGWKEENFMRAMREGKFKGLEGGRQLLPPMPWPNIRKLTDEDLKSMFAYLKSTKPVNNAVPNPVPPTDIK